MSRISRLFSNVYHSCIRFFAHHKTYSAFLLVAITAIFVYGIYSSPITVEKTEVSNIDTSKKSIMATGVIQEVQSKNLVFPTSGKVSYIGVRVGDVVPEGKVLATLEGGDTPSLLIKAEFTLASLQTKLNLVTFDDIKEELNSKKQQLQATQGSLNELLSTTRGLIMDIDAVTSGTIKNTLSDLFVIRNGGYDLAFSTCNQNLHADIVSSRNDLENVLADFQKKSGTISVISSLQSLDSTFSLAYVALAKTNDLVNKLSTLLSYPCGISNSSRDQYRQAVIIAKTNITTLFSQVEAKKTALLVTKNEYTQITKEIDTLTANSNRTNSLSDISLISEAKNKVIATKKALQMTMIVAPYQGVVTEVTMKEGDAAVAGKKVITMTTADAFEVETILPESDIEKIQIGTPARITFSIRDALITVPAKVVSIMELDGVSEQLVQIAFTSKDARITNGMTAQITIPVEN